MFDKRPAGVSIFDCLMEEKLSKKQKKLKSNTDQILKENNDATNVEINILDHIKAQRSNAKKAIQQVLQWIFIKDTVNPLWLFIKNKSSIRNIIIISAPLNGRIMDSLVRDKKTSTLFQEAFDKKNVCPFRPPKKFKTESFWQQIFSSDMNPQGDYTRQLNQADEMNQVTQENIYQSYKRFVLDDDELIANLYPNKKLDLYKNFYETEENSNFNSQNFEQNIFSVDCEMVTTEFGFELARISMVDYHFNTIMDEFVKPIHNITNYNTLYSGITEDHLKNVSQNVYDIQQKLKNIINKDTILIGHSLENDLMAMKMIHQNVIDTSVLYQVSENRKVSLKNLAFKHLGCKIQQDQTGHDSVIDAKVSLSLAKLRIEIFDKIPTTYFNKNLTVKCDILQNLIKQQLSVLPLDKKDNIGCLLKYGIHYEQLEQNSMNDILGCLKKKVNLKKTNGINQPNVILCRIQDNGIDQTDYLLLFDQKFNEIYELSEKNTVFMVVSDTSQIQAQKKPKQETLYESEDNDNNKETNDNQINETIQNPFEIKESLQINPLDLRDNFGLFFVK